MSEFNTMASLLGVYSEFNTIASLLGVYQEADAKTRLNKKLGADATDRTQQAIAQWSQLIAWSWLDPDDYEEQEKPSAEQENLRQAFINTLKELARSCLTEHYSPGTVIDQIVAGSDTLSQYLNGELSSENGLTLPALYQQLTGKDDYVFQKEFTEIFVFVVNLERFNGFLAGYIEDNGNIKDKFVGVLAYPPRPALSPSVLTASELRDWSQGLGDGGYTPPNPYIPTCFC
jgi:hypothetical protein